MMPLLFHLFVHYSYYLSLTKYDVLYLRGPSSILQTTVLTVAFNSVIKGLDLHYIRNDTGILNWLLL